MAPDVTEWKVGDRVVAAIPRRAAIAFIAGKARKIFATTCFFSTALMPSPIVVPRRIVEKNMPRLRTGTALADAALTEPLACVVQGWADLAARPGAAGFGDWQRADRADVHGPGAS